MSDLSESEKQTLNSLIASAPKPSKFKWDDNFQRRILGLILTDSFFLVQSKSLIQPEYFTNEAHVQICGTIYEYHEKYKSMPEKFVVKQILLEKIKGKQDSVILYYQNELENIYEAFVPSTSSREILLDKILIFAKTQALRIAMDVSQKDLKKDPESEEVWTKIYERFRDAMNVNKNFEIGFESSRILRCSLLTLAKTLVLKIHLQVVFQRSIQLWQEVVANEGKYLHGLVCPERANPLAL